MLHADAISNYSATEGADSHPASGGGTPTGDEGQIGQGKGDELKSTCHSLIGNKNINTDKKSNESQLENKQKVNFNCNLPNRNAN